MREKPTKYTDKNRNPWTHDGSTYLPQGSQTPRTKQKAKNQLKKLHKTPRTLTSKPHPNHRSQRISSTHDEPRIEIQKTKPRKINKKITGIDRWDTSISIPKT